MNQRRSKSEWDTLISTCLGGDKKAVTTLIQELQPLVYNLAVRMVLNPGDAEDVAQEVLLKVLLNLGTYDSAKAGFITWVFSITRHHCMDMQRKPLEKVLDDFEDYGKALDQIPDHEIPRSHWEQPETAFLIKEANVGCMLGMLLCLDREQRFILILGDILELDHNEGALACDLTPANFRQKLARARQDLYGFMKGKCGLINKANPCRCHRKTKGFIQAGWVDPNNLKFVDSHYQGLEIFSEQHADLLCDIESAYGAIFRKHPSYQPRRDLLTVEELFADPRWQKTFQL